MSYKSMEITETVTRSIMHCDSCGHRVHDWIKIIVTDIGMGRPAEELHFCNWLCLNAYSMSKAAGED